AGTGGRPGRQDRQPAHLRADVPGRLGALGPHRPRPDGPAAPLAVRNGGVGGPRRPVRLSGVRVPAALRCGDPDRRADLASIEALPAVRLPTADARDRDGRGYPRAAPDSGGAPGGPPPSRPGGWASDGHSSASLRLVVARRRWQRPSATSTWHTSSASDCGLSSFWPSPFWLFAWCSMAWSLSGSGRAHWRDSTPWRGTAR